MRKSLIILVSFFIFLGSFENLSAQVAFGNFRSENQYISIFDDFTNISIADPRTHGEFRARLSGRRAHISLVNGATPIVWHGETSSFGALSLWGRPFIDISQAGGISEIDFILRRFVAENKNIFQISSQELMLDRNRTKFSGVYKYITYQRVYRVENVPYPVQGAFMTFRFKFNRLIEITNYSFGKIAGVEEPTISMQDAFETVIGDCEFDHRKDKLVGKVVPEVQPYFTENRSLGFRFVYRMQIYKDRPAGSWTYLVGARDGRIVQLVNNFRTAGHVEGEIYPRKVGDEIVSAPVAEAMVSGGGRSGRTDMQGNYALETSGVTAELSGLRVVVKERGRDSVKAQDDGSGNIMFGSHQFLSESMAYVHVSKINAFVRNFLQSAPRSAANTRDDFLNSPIVVNTRVNHPVIKDCNAWYDGETRDLNFIEANANSRCESSSQFSDVIYHEWGHALDDALGGIQDSAFSEAIGDITAVLMTDDPRIGPGFIRGSENPIRNINVLKVYPRDRGKDPHLESLIVSGAWYETYQMMKKQHGPEEGRRKTAEIFFKHLVSADAYDKESYLAAITVDDDDGNLENCTPHMCFFNVAFAKRGIATADPRCFSREGEQQSGLPACADSTLPIPDLGR